MRCCVAWIRARTCASSAWPGPCRCAAVPCATGAQLRCVRSQPGRGAAVFLPIEASVHAQPDAVRPMALRWAAQSCTSTRGQKPG